MKPFPTLSVFLIAALLLSGCRFPASDDGTPPERSSASGNDPCLQGT